MLRQPIQYRPGYTFPSLNKGDCWGPVSRLPEMSHRPRSRANRRRGVMQQVAAEICEKQSVADVESRIAPLGEIFRLQGAYELLEAEKRYTGLGANESAQVSSSEDMTLPHSRSSQ